MLTFSKTVISELLEHSRAATQRSPTFEQLMNPEYHKHPIPDDTELPTIDDIDLSRIPPGLHLVADHGIYFMSNGFTPEGETRRVEYAKEGHPRNSPDWYDTKVFLFGGDDTVLFLDELNATSWINRTPRDTLMISKYDSDSIRLH